MFDFFKLKEESFGLDISDSSLRIIKLKKKGNFYDLASFGETRIIPGIIENGEIKNKNILADIIKQLISNIKGEKIKTKNVICSLPEEKAFLRVIQIPKVKIKNLKSTVIYEAENYIPLPLEEIYFDFQIIKCLNNQQKYFNVLISALPKKIIETYIDCLKEVGLNPLALEIESLSTSRALVKKENYTQSIFLIDLSQSKTSFIIFSGYSVRFTSSIPVSGQHFTEIISKAFKIDITEAEILKIKWSLGQNNEFNIKNGKEKEIEKDEIFELLTPLMTELVEQIKKHLIYYQTHIAKEHLPIKEQKVKEILLCGKGAALKGLAYFLSLELKLPVIVGNPWINVLPKSSDFLSFLKDKQLSYEDTLGYSTAIGLALRGIKYD